jgi:hypothetical protein
MVVMLVEAWERQHYPLIQCRLLTRVVGGPGGGNRRTLVAANLKRRGNRNDEVATVAKP